MERELSPHDYLFRPTKNPVGTLEKKLNPKSIDYIIKKYCQKMGLDGRYSPHSARATYIGSALENGADLYRVSQDVGHSYVTTTQEYDKRRRRLKDSPIHQLGFFHAEIDETVE
jgi:site-specific recombinase XerD